MRGGAIFTSTLMLVCAVSRSIRSVEIRVPHGYFTGVESWHLGPAVRGKKVHLVPVRTSSAEALRRKKAEVVRHYASGGTKRPGRSPLVRGFAITPAETEDLVAFLESLTDREFLTNPAFSDPHIK